MNFTDVFIKRPVFASVLSLIILLIGARAYFALPVREYPKIDVTAVTVTVNYPGASASLMEGFVTTPIENAISGVEGIDYMTSSSVPGQSKITIYFKLGYDVNAAVVDVSDQVTSVRYQLPRDVYDPIIAKNDPNANPTVYLTFKASGKDAMTPEELTDYLIRVIQPQLQLLSGVGQVQIYSAHQYAMRVWLDPYQMAAKGVTANDINLAIYYGNVQAASGSVKSSLQQLNINTLTDLHDAVGFNNLVIRNNNGQLVRIRDVGRAELGATTYDVSLLVDGDDGIVVAITPLPNANPLDVSDAVKNFLVRAKSNLPTGVTYQTLVDTSDFIIASIDEVKKTIVEASICVIIIVFMFLGSFRVLAIPAVTMPLSLIGVFGVMLALHYSLNTMTYLALVLAIGMVVDDAIVVSENIHRHLVQGKSPFEAALVGAGEIKFAIISITLTLAAVYAPIGFMSGLTGDLFREFAFTLASAVIISGFIAITLSPMMCSKVMTPNVLDGNLAKKIEHFTNYLATSYHRILEKVLTFRKFVVLGMLLIFGSCYFLFTSIPQELAPAEDMGWIFTYIIGPADANVEYMAKYTSRLTDIFGSLPELSHYGIVNGAGGHNAGIAFMSLKPWDQRHRSVSQILQQILPQCLSIPGVLAFPTNPFSLPGASSYHPITVAIETLGSYEDLNTVSQQVMAEMRKNPKIINIDSDLKMDESELDININRDQAGDLGINMQDIAMAINLAYGQPLTTYFSINGRAYQVLPELEDRFRNRPDVINTLQVRTTQGGLVPLSNLVDVKDKTYARTLNHFQQLRAATISADLAPGYTMGQALDYINAAIKKYEKPKMQVDYSGQTRQFVQTSNTMLVTFLFAVIFIFLVLAAQFESFADPFVVLLSVPLSTFGALVALKLTGGTLNIYSEIGLVTLIGLITKHGILMVEFANQLQEQGKHFYDAIVEAAMIRLRPILMTTGAMVLGALPLAFAHSAGALSRQQIGWVIVGGMSIGTIFTLFVIPTMYTFFADNFEKKKLEKTKEDKDATEKLEKK